MKRKAYVWRSPVTRSLFLALAAPILTLASTAAAQTPPVGGPKPVSRADFVKKLDAAFGAVDSNHDGVWSKAELNAAQTHAVQQRLQGEFKQLDTNHDGQLSYQEFAAAAHVNVNADQMLQKLDANHDGKVTADEFRAPQLANFAKIDANHDGIVSPDEVRKAMSGNK
jgi:Ca2+-binding EF-hand superfamily protein